MQPQRFCEIGFQETQPDRQHKCERALPTIIPLSRPTLVPELRLGTHCLGGSASSVDIVTIPNQCKNKGVRGSRRAGDAMAQQELRPLGQGVLGREKPKRPQVKIEMPVESNGAALSRGWGIRTEFSGKNGRKDGFAVLVCHDASSFDVSGTP